MQNNTLFDEIKDKIREMPFDNSIDVLIFIWRGWIIPGALINQRLKLPYYVLQIRFRDDSHTPEYDAPKLMDESFDVRLIAGKNILLIDDVSRTWKTFEKAKEILSHAKSIKTFVVNWNADYALYTGECFRFPWLL